MRRFSIESRSRKSGIDNYRSVISDATEAGLFFEDGRERISKHSYLSAAVEMGVAVWLAPRAGCWF